MFDKSVVVVRHHSFYYKINKFLGKISVRVQNYFTIRPFVTVAAKLTVFIKTNKIGCSMSKFKGTS